MGPTSAHDHMTPPHLGGSSLDGDTRAETPSRDQATGGPNPIDAASPMGVQGDRRHPVAASALDDLLLLPQRFGDLAREIRNLRNLLAMAFAPVAWDAVPATIDVAGTALGAGSWVRVFNAYGGTGVEIRNMQVGSSAAGIVRVQASRADQIYTDRAGRAVSSVRLTAQALCAPAPQLIHLAPDEHLYLWNSAAAANFDFSAEFRARRSE